MPANQAHLEEASADFLCALHGVVVYRTEDFSHFPDYDPADAGKFVVTVPAFAFEEDVVRGIPLADSLAEAQALAVAHLGLTLD